MWTYDAASKRMINRDVKYVPGFFKIVDEILVNAADNKVIFPKLWHATKLILYLDKRPFYGHLEDQH